MLLVPHSGSQGITAQTAILVMIQQHTHLTGKGGTGRWVPMPACPAGQHTASVPPPVPMCLLSLCTPDSTGCPRKVPHIPTGQRVAEGHQTFPSSTASCSALPPVPGHVASCSVIYLLSHSSVFKQVISGLIRTGMHPWHQSSVGA